MIGIIGAMDIEVDYLKDKLEDLRCEKRSGVDFCVGKIFGKETVVARCGVGKVYAALCAQTMIDFYNPSVILNTGVAGALVSGLKVFDVVIAEKTCQHDMDTSALGDPKGLISGINKVFFECDTAARCALEGAAAGFGLSTHSGTIATGDKFVSDSADKAVIASQFGACACEMEGGSIGQICCVNDVPYAVLRTISDGDGGNVDYMEFAPKAAMNAAKIAEKFVELY